MQASSTIMFFACWWPLPSTYGKNKLKKVWHSWLVPQIQIWNVWQDPGLLHKSLVNLGMKKVGHLHKRISILKSCVPEEQHMNFGKLKSKTTSNILKFDKKKVHTSTVFWEKKKFKADKNQKKSKKDYFIYNLPS